MGTPLAWLALPLLAMPRIAKRSIALAVDASLCVLTVWIAFYLRLDTWVRLSGDAVFQPQLAVAVSLVLALPLFITHGFYRVIFRHSSLHAIAYVVRAFGIYGLLYMAVITAVGLPGVPRSIGIIQPMLLLLAVGASRAVARYWLGGMYQSQLRRAALPKVLVYGAGSAGRQLVAALGNSHEMQVVGFLDDDDRLHGHVLNGLPIYSPDDLSGLVESQGIGTVLLAMPSIGRRRRNEILATMRAARVLVRTLPSVTDLAQGKVSTSDLRELDIDDLLGRESVAPNHILLGKNITGKVVLVTGAGGSIGSELCRQILKLDPARLLLVEINEHALYSIHAELEQLQDEHLMESGHADIQAPASVPPIVPLLASVRDETHMRAIISTWQPDTIYHAAAYKHVPLVEHNPAEGVRNNVWGTLVTASVAAEQGVSDFVLISTDKAVRPTNIMGASKRLAEMVLQALVEKSPRTRFTMVRFGNVLGSSGSVVPKFRQQIRDGGPVTLTHPDITRYFMTIPEATELVIQAGAMAKGGEVFVLDMGQPVRIMDLARRMIELSGLTVQDASNPEGDIEIVITGLRPGEKLYEELLIGDNPNPTPHPRIMKANEDFLPWPVLEEKLRALELALDLNDVGVIRRMLQQLVSGYSPGSEIVDWVHLEQEAQADSLEPPASSPIGQ
ncbi:polysaccharide biosynthesis protein [Bordetella sp. 2513F-2]